MVAAFSWSARDLQRLAGVHPTLVADLLVALSYMSNVGHPMFVVMGVRTVAEQQALYAEGRTAPGRIVTMADGVKFKSNHQPHADGFGYAVDCAFQGADLWDVTTGGKLYEWYGEQLEARGLVWGGRWSHPHDCPHAELPASLVLPHPGTAAA